MGLELAPGGNDKSARDNALQRAKCHKGLPADGNIFDAIYRGRQQAAKAMGSTVAILESDEEHSPPIEAGRSSDQVGSKKRSAPAHSRADHQLSSKHYKLTKDFLDKLAREKYESLVGRNMRTKCGGPNLHSIPRDLLTTSRSNCLLEWAQSTISEEYGEEAREAYTHAIMQDQAVGSLGPSVPSAGAA